MYLAPTTHYLIFLTLGSHSWTQVSVPLLSLTLKSGKVVPVPCPVLADSLFPRTVAFLCNSEFQGAPGCKTGVPDTRGGRDSGWEEEEFSPAISPRRLGPCLWTLPFPTGTGGTESGTGEKQARIKMGIVRSSGGPWLVALSNSLGEFEAVPLAAPRRPRIRKSPRGPRTPVEERLRGRDPGLHPFPEMEEFGSSSG